MAEIFNHRVGPRQGTLARRKAPAAASLGVAMLLGLVSAPAHAYLPPYYSMFYQGVTSASSVDLDTQSGVAKGGPGALLINYLPAGPMPPDRPSSTPFSFANGDDTSFALGVNLTDWNTSASAGFEVFGSYTNMSATTTAPMAHLHVDRLNMSLIVDSPGGNGGHDYALDGVGLVLRYSASLQVFTYDPNHDPFLPGFTQTAAGAQSHATITYARNGNNPSVYDLVFDAPANAGTFALESYPVATLSAPAHGEDISFGSVASGQTIYYAISYTLDALAYGHSAVSKPYLFAKVGDPLSIDASGRTPLISIDDGTALAPVPEPGTWALMLAGLGVVCAARRRMVEAGK